MPTAVGSPVQGPAGRPVPRLVVAARVFSPRKDKALEVIYCFSSFLPRRGLAPNSAITGTGF